MLTDEFKNLLILQDRDLELQAIEQELESYPLEKINLGKQKREIEQKLSQTEDEVKALEVKIKDLSGQVEDLRQKRVKYKTQQLEVKKNEELQALELEIQNVEQKISDLEDEEIQLMMDLDDAKVTLQNVQKIATEGLTEIEDQNIVLIDREKESQSKLQVAKDSFQAARDVMVEKFLRAYDQVKKQVKKAPYIVELNGLSCSGCHLKVSNDLQSSCRDTKRIIHCDQCNRILYKG